MQEDIYFNASTLVSILTIYIYTHTHFPSSMTRCMLYYWVIQIMLVFLKKFIYIKIIFYLFFKIYFWYQHIKMIQKHIKNILKLKKLKI